jgi:D-aminoacyl-tRNA deacylase
MRILVQRVSSGSVSVLETGYHQSIGFGLVVFVGIAPKDSDSILSHLVTKLVSLRIFEDQSQKMNLSLKEVEGEVLVISQFTLYADTKKGNRPGFSLAAPPEIALPIFQKFISLLRQELGPDKVKTGVFGREMLIKIHNQGPVTLLLEREV